jgi:hypothetical protein
MYLVEIISFPRSNPNYEVLLQGRTLPKITKWQQFVQSSPDLQFVAAASTSYFAIFALFLQITIKEGMT